MYNLFIERPVSGHAKYTINSKPVRTDKKKKKSRYLSTQFTPPHIKKKSPHLIVVKLKTQYNYFAASRWTKTAHSRGGIDRSDERADNKGHQNASSDWMVGKCEAQPAQEAKDRRGIESQTEAKQA